MSGRTLCSVSELSVFYSLTSSRFKCCFDLTFIITFNSGVSNFNLNVFVKDEMTVFILVGEKQKCVNVSQGRGMSYQNLFCLFTHSTYTEMRC